jgi:hypothetical protein
MARELDGEGVRTIGVITKVPLFFFCGYIIEILPD